MSQSPGNGIAIIGMSCRVAGANSPPELWDNLVSLKDVQSEITRFNVQGYYHPNGGPRKGLTSVRRAYMLDDDAIDKFDNAFFYISPLEAEAMDPQQRMLLEIAYEAVESAGITLDAFRGTDTAVFAGMEGCDYHTIAARDIDATPRYLATGTSTCMAANRLSYFFDLSGPSMSIDTACSSSMAALHQAVRMLQHGDSRMALVCSAKLILNPDMFPSSSELGFLSPSGKCQCFDEAADGYGRGEGVLALLLKPLDLAIADQDPIRAVIKGTRLNQDGRTQGIAMPSADAQLQNMNRLYQEIDLDPAGIQYLEAHGTGTAAGDPTEFSAINAVFGPSRDTVEPLVVGSVKSCIGHLEASSALASIIKVTLCLEKGLIPSQLHFKNPNPKIDFLCTRIPTSVLPWQPATRGIRVAAVNTFGAGGTNGHAVLETVPRASLQRRHIGIRPFLFKLSAADDISLRQLSSELAKYIERCSPNLQDLAYTLLSRRSTLRKSTFFVSRTHDDTVKALRDSIFSIITTNSKHSTKIVFLFTGQGAQWPQMGISLIRNSPLFSAVMRECDRHLSELPDRPCWSIIEELLKPQEVSNVHKAEYSQPLCTALQLGLVTLFGSWGLAPDAVIGHSSGEIAAAYATGSISMRDAIVTSYYRGLVLGKASHDPAGAMCAVGLEHHDTETLIHGYAGRVQIAAVNSATSCTLSGDRDAIQEIVELLVQKNNFCRKLRVDQAYHSHHMQRLGPQYLENLTNAGVGLHSGPAQCQMFSSVTGLDIEPSELTCAYWVKNMTSTVRFSAAVEKCISKFPLESAFIEIGPHPALGGPALEVVRTLGRDDVDHFPTCTRGDDDFESLLRSIGSMIAAGVPLKTPTINAREVVNGLECHHEVGNILTDIPSYQWNHSNAFWSESRISRNVRFRKFPRHELLGSRYLDDIAAHPCWRNQLMLKEVTWLQKLQASGTQDVPPVIFILMASEASRQLSILHDWHRSSLTLRNISFNEPLPMSNFKAVDTTLEIQLVSSQSCDDARVYNFDILAATPGSEETWPRHCSGELGCPLNTKETYLFNPPIIDHDHSLLGMALVFYPGINDYLTTLRINQSGSRGTFSSRLNEVENYPIDPLVLDAILGLPPISLLCGRLPARYRVSNIRSAIISGVNIESDEGSFAIAIQSTYDYTIECNIWIRQGDRQLIIEGLEYEASELITHQSPLTSLFFQPKILWDITKVSNAPAMTLAEIVRLVTHKWPMSDVIIDAVPEASTRKILEAFSMLIPVTRSFCRSIQCIGGPLDNVPERVRFFQDWDSVVEGHILFSHKTHPASQLLEKLHPAGILCAPQVPEAAELDRCLDFLGTVKGLDSSLWSLWRKTTCSTEKPQERNITLFTNDRAWLAIPAFANAKHVSLEPASIAKFCQGGVVETFDAIVVDQPDNSVITTWAGKDLMPWLQDLLQCADSLLWVTTPSKSNPSTQVAGSLLRTLQCERPSLKVQWLVLEHLQDGFGRGCYERVEMAYREMIEAGNEILVQSESEDTRILRYYPDDELSANVGLLPPKRLQEPLGDRDYSIEFGMPGEPVITSINPDIGPWRENNTIRVRVEASVVDIEDVHLFNGRDKNSKSALEHGLFFAGKVNDEITGLKPERHVVGWHPLHRHRKEVEWLESYCDVDTADSTLAEAASAYAAIAVACCIIDGVGRVRSGEMVSVDFDGPLKEALEEVCADVGAIMMKTGSCSGVDFSVTFDNSTGLLLNGRQVEVAKYLESGRGKDTVRYHWRKSTQKAMNIKTFELGDLHEAFQSAHQPCSAVLLHQNATDVTDHVPLYTKPNHLFAADGEYIVIGGLGGLGRYICSWMVQHGAKHITILSRSGMKSSEAKETVAKLRASGASITVNKADACDASQVEQAFSQAREKRPIKGVIHLAMLLADAPMATMTGEEWDRALRVKVDSSWIVHKQTLQDTLDFFVLFSSIASVLGNRNQGNYNVANTYLNALAEYRQTLDLPGTSIALGAMTDIGVLHDLSKPGILPVLTRSGLTHLTCEHLGKIMEAAIHESPRRDRSLIVTGLEMFEREADGSLAGHTEPLFWTELPEFGHLQRYKAGERVSDGAGRSEKTSLRDKLSRLDKEGMKKAVTESFLAFLSRLLGFGADTFDPQQMLTMYGMDSLNGVACQYWFHNELETDVPVMKILGGGSIAEIVEHALKTFSDKS